MKINAVPLYAGDQAFARLLQELRCTMSVHQLKALIYGALAATDHVSPNRIMECLWIGGTAPILEYGQLENLVANTMALWNDLASLPDHTPYPLSSCSPPACVTDLVQHARMREEEMLYFTRGLDLGNTNPTDMTPRAVRALTALSGASALLKQLITIAENQPTPGSETLTTTTSRLRDVDSIISREMSVVLADQKRIRLLALERRTQPAGIGRNTPCPCGSGRKFKQCCGKRQ